MVVRVQDSAILAVDFSCHPLARLLRSAEMKDREVYRFGLLSMTSILLSFGRWALLVVFLFIFLLFLPLIASFSEDLVFGTRYVYNFCNRIGLADVLNNIYEPVEAAIEPLIEP